MLKIFPKRYERVKRYIEKLMVSNNLQEIMNELKKLKSEIKKVYVDIHVYKRVKEFLKSVEVVSENKRLLRRKEVGVLVAFNILDLAMNRYKRRILRD